MLSAIHFVVVVGVLLQLVLKPWTWKRHWLCVEIWIKIVHSRRCLAYKPIGGLRAHPLLIKVTIRNKFAVSHILLIYSALEFIDSLLDVLIVWVEIILHLHHLGW